MPPVPSSRIRLAALVVGLVLPSVGIGTASAGDNASPPESTVTTSPATAAPTSPSAPPAEPSSASDCQPTITISQDQHTDYWSPLRITLAGSFPDHCTVDTSTDLTAQAAAIPGVTFSAGTFPFDHGTMTITTSGAVSFHFDDTFAHASGRVFGGTILLAFDRRTITPSSTLDLSWSGAIASHTPLTVPDCPGCSTMPTINTKWSVIGLPRAGYNDLISGINTLTITQPVIDSRQDVVISDTLTGAQECTRAALNEVSARDASGNETSTTIAAVPCNDDRATVGPVTIPASSLKAGHYYQLIVIAKTTAYQSTGYQDNGAVVISGATVPVSATAMWKTGTAYGGSDGPPAPTPSPSPTDPTTPPTPDPTPSPTTSDPTTPPPPDPTTTAPPEPTPSPSGPDPAPEPPATPTDPPTTPSTTTSSAAPPLPPPPPVPPPPPPPPAPEPPAPPAPEPPPAPAVIPTLPPAPPSAIAALPAIPDRASVAHAASEPHHPAASPFAPPSVIPMPAPTPNSDAAEPAAPTAPAPQVVIAGGVPLTVPAAAPGGLPRSGTELAAMVLYGGVLVAGGLGLLSAVRRRI
ncbi:hypothetical protein KEM60_00895 [Austwickia sp. TVS 96-490-7B]|uniref:hypothetical protein n=1 Tax=Austwickia sp. TVS 96-490-7B TaxID=2830843 RepID=UPI001C56BD58|nr:hypothetical protein [Austwickia sp. TVS 96-490-7B]MBW3084706.1 hypothetical protein [Austwickia sp. TVS 96-490-7B]